MKLFETTFNTSDLPEVMDVLLKGDIGFGANVDLFERQFSSFSNMQYNIATNSASAAAYIIFAYLAEEYGECDVYTPSLGFVSPAWAAKTLGHNVIWVDTNEQLLFSSSDYRYKREKNRTNNTPVVMPILYGGVSNIDNLNLYGDELVVVDSAHCVTPTIDCDFIFFSFHPFKPVCSSDGGMISTDNDACIDYMRSYRNFGRINSNNSYDIKQNGFKFYMNNLNATIAMLSLDKYYENLLVRQSNFYQLEYSNILPHDNNSSYYFATAIATEDNREEMKRNFPTQTHYPLLHKTSFFKNDTILPISEGIWDSIINIPLHLNISDSCKDMWSGG